MKKLIAVVGMSGSGKSIATDYLEKKGFNKIYFGGVVLDELKKAGIEDSPDNEKYMREKLRKDYGMAAMAIVLLPKIKDSFLENDTVLDGLYSWDEYLVLKKEFGDYLKMVGVVNDKKIRYERVSKRKVRPFNKEDIVKRDVSEIENLAKGGPISYADYYILNNGSIDDYVARLEEILKDMEDEVNEKNES